MDARILRPSRKDESGPRARQTLTKGMDYANVVEAFWNLRPRPPIQIQIRLLVPPNGPRFGSLDWLVPDGPLDLVRLGVAENRS